MLEAIDRIHVSRWTFGADVQVFSRAFGKGSFARTNHPVRLL